MLMCLHFVFIWYRTCDMSYYCNTVGWTWWDWSLILRTASSFSALTLLIESSDP